MVCWVRKEKKGIYVLEGSVVATSLSSIKVKILKLGTKVQHGSVG